MAHFFFLCFSRGLTARAFGLRPKMCRPSADTKNSRHTREKPLVPRVLALNFPGYFNGNDRLKLSGQIQKKKTILWEKVLTLQWNHSPTVRGSTWVWKVHLTSFPWFTRAQSLKCENKNRILTNGRVANVTLFFLTQLRLRKTITYSESIMLSRFSK